MLAQKVALDPNAPYPMLKGIEYVELFVGNVRQAAHYYRTVWGFQVVAFRGLETGSRDRTSIVLRQGNITIVLTGAIESSSNVAEHLQLHGEGVARVAFAVSDLEVAYQAAVRRGATSIREPQKMSDENGDITHAEVKAFEGFSHVFVERISYQGVFFPGFKAIPSTQQTAPCLGDLDHIAIAVESGSLESWVAFYQGVFGFELAHREDVATEQSGMNSRVVQHPSGICKFPIVEPAPGKRKSQIQEFLAFHKGPGVQHLAVSTPSIISTVSKLRNNGVEFLRVPSTYYDALERRVGRLGDELNNLRELGVLVDHDEWGQLLQIFARPCQDRPTMFFEVVERRGARGFGSGNIRALFEAIEQEQGLRGTL
jgi:4-hydroxyphenylpyruvate dioxygenase